MCNMAILCHPRVHRDDVDGRDAWQNESIPFVSSAYTDRTNMSSVMETEQRVAVCTLHAHT